MSRSEVITSEDVMKWTDNGRLVFERELGHIPKKAINSPLRSDKNPSFTVFQSNSGIWCYKDFSNDDSSNAIKFIQERYNLSFNKALEYIYNNLGCKNQEIVGITQHKAPKKGVTIDYSVIPFTSKHKAYFDQYGLPEDYLNKNDVWAIDKYAINKKVIKIPDNQYCFVYEAKDIGKCKILTLGEDVKSKWINSAPNTYLWGYNELKNKKCDELWLNKSWKDALVMKYHFNKCSIALQNEDAKIYLNNNIEKVENISDNIILALGTDDQGKTQSIKISKERGYKWFNIPNALYENYNLEDVSDYLSQFSVKSLANLLKIKKML